MERNWCTRGQVVALCVFTWLLLSLVIVSPAEGQTPSNLQAVANGDSAIDLSWTAPSVSLGQSIQGYKIESTPDTTMAWTTLRENTGTTATTFRHGGLPPDTTIYYRVRTIILDLLGIHHQWSIECCGRHHRRCGGGGCARPAEGPVR